MEFKFTNNYTALYFAVAKGDIEIVRLLLAQKGIDTNLKEI